MVDESPRPPAVARRHRTTPEERALMAQVHAEHSHHSWPRQLEIYNAEAEKRGLYSKVLLATFSSNCVRVEVEQQASVKRELGADANPRLTTGATGSRWEKWEDEEIIKWSAKGNRAKNYPAFIKHMRTTYDPEYSRSLGACMSRVYSLSIQRNSANECNLWKPWEDLELRKWGKTNMSNQEHEEFINRMRETHGQEYSRAYLEVLVRLRSLNDGPGVRDEATKSSDEVPATKRTRRPRRPWKPWEDKEVLLWGKHRFRRRNYPTLIERIRANYDPDYSRSYETLENRLQLLRALERSTNTNSALDKRESERIEPKVEAGTAIASGPRTAIISPSSDKYCSAEGKGDATTPKKADITSDLEDADDLDNIEKSHGSAKGEEPPKANDSPTSDNALRDANKDVDAKANASATVDIACTTKSVDEVFVEATKESSTNAANTSIGAVGAMVEIANASSTSNPDTGEDTNNSADKAEDTGTSNKVPDRQEANSDDVEITADSIQACTIKDSADVVDPGDDNNTADCVKSAENVHPNNKSTIVVGAHSNIDTNIDGDVMKIGEAASVDPNTEIVADRDGSPDHDAVDQSNSSIEAVDAPINQCNQATQTEINTHEAATSTDNDTPVCLSAPSTQSLPVPASQDSVKEKLMEARMLLEDRIEVSGSESDSSRSGKMVEQQKEASGLLKRVVSLVSGKEVSPNHRSRANEEDQKSDQPSPRIDLIAVIKDLEAKLKAAEDRNIEIASQSFKERHRLEKKYATLRVRCDVFENTITKLRLENASLTLKLDTRAKSENYATSHETSRKSAATLDSMLESLPIGLALATPSVAANATTKDPPFDESNRPRKRARVDPVSRLSELAAALADADKTN